MDRANELYLFFKTHVKLCCRAAIIANIVEGTSVAI